MTYDPTNWLHRDPEQMNGHWCFMNAQGTPFYYALFDSFQDAINARELYLHAIRKAGTDTLLNVAQKWPKTTWERAQ